MKKELQLVNNKLKYHILNQRGNPVNDDQVKDQVRNQVGGQISNQVSIQVSSQIRDQIRHARNEKRA